MIKLKSRILRNKKMKTNLIRRIKQNNKFTRLIHLAEAEKMIKNHKSSNQKMKMIFKVIIVISRVTLIKTLTNQ